MVSTFVRIPGYRLTEELYNGSRTLVYRGYQETDSLAIVIKLLKNPYPSFGELLSFRNQYTIAKNLNSPLIVQTYSLEPYQNGYALVMEDFGGISLKEWKLQGNLQSLQEFLEIAIALCDTLNLLYHERIIHKDIKASNILINPKTKQVKLIDFSIASLLPRETQILVNPNVLEGTLAYISPEQTGRMNRGIDYRTDFYSLGVTFYELLTGELPFASNDPMELVHSHIAKIAPLVHKINDEISSVLSKIVSKLMAKNAEDRYQSALGLKFDLENCLHQLKETGEIQNFEIATRDVCDRFIIPDKLYGREAEVSTLLEAFERVSFGATEMMLVAGFSGIGKTAVVNEVHKPIVRQRGYFIKGKYEQFQRNIPFSAFVQAFRDLMGQLLTESDAQIQEWRNKILEAVGENGQVIIEVIPELENIIGKQALSVELSGTSAQNRFNLLFQKFTQVFTSKEHPLVMFLDDLQWADSASLKLMQLLMADTGNLFIIGAYRDNEVTAGHPLLLTLSEIQKTQAIINTIALAPLSQVQVNELVADTLKCSEDLAWNLSGLIYQKTQGNPFFATQFLKALHQDGLIQFDFELGCWQCDISQVTMQAVTDDVVAFMSLQLRKLPPSTQEIIKLAACIGNSFDLATLAIVAEKSQIETATCLWKALQEGLIVPIDDVYKFYVGQEKIVDISTNQHTVAYKFIHDRVQQAAYFLIPDDQKQATHYEIGRLLLQNTPEAKLDANIFEVVNHLNTAIDLIRDNIEREGLAQLNLVAGRKAKASSAYKQALRYLEIGIQLLSEDSWFHQYALSLALHIETAETALLNTNFDRAQQLIETLVSFAENLLNKVKVYEIQIQGYIAQGKLLEALQVGQQILQYLGVALPDSHSLDVLQQELEKIATLYAGKSIESLIHLPQMTAPEQIAAMRVLAKLWSPAFLAHPSLTPLIVLKQVELSLQYGHTSESTFAYAAHAITLISTVGDIETGYRFGQLALNLLDHLGSKENKARTEFLVNNLVIPWKQHTRITLAPLLKAYQTALETGDFEFASYSVLVYCYHSYFIGDDLLVLEQAMKTFATKMEQLKQTAGLTQHILNYQTVLNLLGRSTNPIHLVGEAFDETAVSLVETKNQTVICVWYFHKLILAYLFEARLEAIAEADRTQIYLEAIAGLPYVPVFHFYDSLARLRVLPDVAPAPQELILEQVCANQTKLKTWASYAPMNFQHKYDLVEAENRRVLGQSADAIDLYDRAIAGAKANGYIQEAALANELAAKFYLNWGKERIAQDYMIEAYYSYAHWGAKAKVVDLETRYPKLLAPILQQNRWPLSTYETIFSLETVTSTSSCTSSSTSVSNTLDLTAILKASQAISGEIEFQKLLASLLSIVIETSGADKCVLMLLQDKHLQIQGAITQGTQPIVLQSLAIEDSKDIPHKLIYKVKNNQQTVVLSDATADTTLANDAYIIRQQPKSILCSPILHQGKLLGILYLENNLATGAFTRDRVELLNLLCTQAAISLENAQLYERSLESLLELNAAQSRFHNLVNNVPGVVCQYQMSADGILSLNYISADCYNLYEITPEKAAADPDFLDKMIHPDDVASYLQTYTDTVQARSSWWWEGRIITPSGIVKWLHGESRVEQRPDGSLVWDGLFLDISDRKIAELGLQQAQLQIVQSEKMSALGNLVAGVAHEMNNPLGFIAASLKQAKPTFTDIVDHLKLYQETLPDKSEEIEDHAEEIDLEYSLSDLPKMFDSMTMACDRLKNISTSLRTFSRADRDYKVLFNIHEGIDSTILILKHRLKANEQRPAIEVVTNYGNLPQIECFPGQLNQVFMNILANAIDAIDESNVGRSFEDIQANLNRITLSTSITDNLVQIAIADNGKGMSESVKSQIFDHLFTTKAVGNGTGLGLAIAKQIVESTHGGKLSCNSVLGEGTEFIVEIAM
ncbi:MULTISPECIES: AAA family ATPase [unclassified Nostoc]|uniref:trifunctional serine/threonine-protein kinase/ATP-binding protein/sensor histidine kinase n=1 Tax=unclassified Nostoc TaxID=2593658 RepID=UPI002AD205E2|nr:AAA family ATPase [Nostoc sp. DedQUE03]MDZ7974291.1 AAA family ATPase [Nostoc sp. DedQUE03]MDZ8043586.1 AAA family ATPase [Nostoc sp. DedQUE02]